MHSSYVDGVSFVIYGDGYIAAKHTVPDLSDSEWMESCQQTECVAISTVPNLRFLTTVIFMSQAVLPFNFVAFFFYKNTKKG